MATIAIGDIHGNRAGLDEVLAQVRQGLTADDTVVFLGDYIDRGPDSKGCVDSILAFQRDVPAHVSCLYGNHEDWFLNALRDDTDHAWLLAMDGWLTIESYSREAARALREAAARAKGRLYEPGCRLPYHLLRAAIPPAHIQFFESLHLYWRTPEALCVHAGVDTSKSRVEEQTRHELVLGWGACGFPDEYEGDELVVYGHRNNAVVDARGWPMPRVVGRTIGLDTSRHGVVSAVRLPDMTFLQSGRHLSEPAV